MWERRWDDPFRSSEGRIERGYYSYYYEPTSLIAAAAATCLQPSLLQLPRTPLSTSGWLFRRPSTTTTSTSAAASSKVSLYRYGTSGKSLALSSRSSNVRDSLLGWQRLASSSIAAGSGQQFAVERNRHESRGRGKRLVVIFLTVVNKRCEQQPSRGCVGVGVALGG